MFNAAQHRFCNKQLKAKQMTSVETKRTRNCNIQLYFRIVAILKFAIYSLPILQVTNCVCQLEVLYIVLIHTVFSFYNQSLLFWKPTHTLCLRGEAESDTYYPRYFFFFNSDLVILCSIHDLKRLCRALIFASIYFQSFLWLIFILIFCLEIILCIMQVDDTFTSKCLPVIST